MLSQIDDISRRAFFLRAAHDVLREEYPTGALFRNATVRDIVDACYTAAQRHPDIISHD